MNVLFVCTGNMCRSPMAEALARRIVADRRPAGRVEFSSAGTHAMVGHGATPEAVGAVAELGVDLADHRPQQLTPDLLDRFDVVICMTRDHLRAVRRMGPDSNAMLLNVDDSEVTDPYGMTMGFYRQIRDEIADSLEDRLPDWAE